MEVFQIPCSGKFYFSRCFVSNLFGTFLQWRGKLHRMSEPQLKVTVHGTKKR
jgi:hypothetical protein